MASVVTLASKSSIVTLDSEESRVKELRLIPLYEWCFTMYQSVMQAMMREAPAFDLQCEQKIATFTAQIQQHRPSLAVFPPTQDKMEQKLQQLYMQKTEVKQKTIRLLVKCILASWKEMYAIAKTIDAKQKQIHDEAEKTRAYYNDIIAKKLEPLVQGRKLISVEGGNPQLTNQTYRDQKAKCDAAMQALKGIQNQHDAFWAKASTSTPLDELKQIKQKEEEALRTANAEVDKLTVIRKSMLEEDVSTASPSFSIAQANTEEAERYLRSFQRIVEEECNCHKYQILEYNSELKKVMDREIDRMNDMIKVCEEEEAKLLKECDENIRLVWSCAKRDNMRKKMEEDFQKIDREKEIERRKYAIKEIGTKCATMFSSSP